MTNPLDDALAKRQADASARKVDDAERGRVAAEARISLIEMAEDFRRRMKVLGNPGLLVFSRKRFRVIQAWFIGWTWSDYRGGFWLRPDGTSLQGMDWVPLRDKIFFGVDRAGKPSPLDDAWRGTQHANLIATHLEMAANAMAAIIERRPQ